MNRTDDHPTWSEVETKVRNAIEHLVYRDRFLLENDVNERSISHKLAAYLQIEFGDEWDVDCEYNRNHDITKRLIIPPNDDKVKIDDTTARTVFPDIIVHRRNSDDNLLVIEVKKGKSDLERRDFDLRKLRAFQGKNYHYLYALYLQIKTECAINVDNVIEEMRLNGEIISW